MIIDIYVATYYMYQYITNTSLCLSILMHY